MHDKKREKNSRFIMEFQSCFDVFAQALEKICLMLFFCRSQWMCRLTTSGWRPMLVFHHNIPNLMHHEKIFDKIFCFVLLCFSLVLTCYNSRATLFQSQKFHQRAKKMEMEKMNKTENDLWIKFVNATVRNDDF